MDNLNPMNQLGICLMLDVLGALTYIIPGLGEFADVIYAPVQGMFAWRMFGGETWGMMWTVIAMGEELLPFVDIFPSMTIGWVIKYLM